MSTVVGGKLGGNLVVDAQNRVTVFFCERYIMGCPCEVHLGPVLDDLLRLQPGEHLRQPIAGIDDIHATLVQNEVLLYFISTYHHPTNVAVVSQLQLCLAVQSRLAAV